jgi:purine nucleosidase
MAHDGDVELLLTMKHIKLLGFVVTSADYHIQAAMSATGKIIDLMGFSHIPVAESTAFNT